ncbi:ribosome-binding protein 1 isoform X2 [Plodia interpunctella]|uniref:ribosome-binding protein 1 isoform X2 n=1 Tax=Plodia interpunctella TaxID=58824 RepID=UPI002367A35A|nr:ribosome-binding protein 1 isoform X2 [Plodia interpunctella]
MELPAVLVLCGLGVAGIAVLLLVVLGLFSTSGTSYEEAIAQQRRATTELLALAENKSKQKKSTKKASKKLAKKEKNKENAAAATASELESEAPAESGVEDDVVPAKPHVDFSPPVVVDVPRDTPPNVKIRKRGKDPKVKPILVNKEDPSCVSDPSTVPVPTESTVSNHFEELHPKDEFELLHSSLTVEKAAEKKEEVVEKKEVKAVKAAKGGKAAPKPAPAEVKEDVARERHNSGDAPKDQRKAKKVEKKSEEVSDIREEVVPPLNAPQPSELTTEKLLKQALAPSAAPAPASSNSPPATKNKKKKPEPNVLALMAGDGGGVNVGELVRVVREAPLSRTEIQILTDALLNKHHDPLVQHAEWTEGPNDPIQKLKKQLADKEKALADEIEASQAVHAKLKELRATLNAERGRAAAASRAAEQAAATARAELHTLQTRLQRVIDENHALVQDKLMLQSQDAEFQAQRVQMEVHIQRLTETEGQLVSQLNALQAELSALQADRNARLMELSAARCELSSVRDSLIMLQQNAADFKQQLQEANRLCAEYADQIAQQDIKLAQERHSATSELQNEVQRLTARAQTAESSLEKLKEESEKQKQKLSAELSAAAREAELLKAAPAHNGLPNHDNQHKSAELEKVERLVETLRGELAAAQRCSAEQRDQLTALQDQLNSYQHKNNELRTKNWKVMEALQSAEKALQAKSAGHPATPAQDSLRDALAKAQEAHYNEVASVLRSACPALAPSAAVDGAWLRAFADNLTKQLAAKEAEKQELEKKLAALSSAPAADPRRDELVAQNEHLQALVDKYKRIIDDTEGVLSRLQQNVTHEEQRWAQQLADTQRELEETRHRAVLQEPLAFAYSCIEKSLPNIVAEMQKKIDALQIELQQAQAANHNHSFADAERLAEERLMGGLPSKLPVDTHNGPQQVGLEEK